MPSNFAAVTTSLGKGRDVGARHQALGSDAIRSGEGKRETGKEGSRDRLGENGRRDRGDGTFGTGSGNREKEEASEEVGRKGNVVDRLSTVNVSYPRVDCNSG